jgi:glycosyltransferase involved in cell wall biosynthesis
LSPEKGVDVAIRAVGALRDRGIPVYLHIIGYGPLEEELCSLTNELGLQGQVHFYGVQTNDWVKSFLVEHCDTHLYVQPSRREALGQSILEAMAAGLPVVAARVGGIPELITDGGTGLLFEVESTNSLVDCIIRLMNNPQLANQLGSKAKEVALEYFTVSRECASFTEWYTQLIRNNKTLP